LHFGELVPVHGCPRTKELLLYLGLVSRPLIIMDQTTRQTPHNTQTEPSAVGNRAGRNQVGPSPTELTSLRGRKPPTKSSNSPTAYRVVVNKASPLLRLDTDIGLVQQG